MRKGISRSCLFCRSILLDEPEGLAWRIYLAPRYWLAKGEALYVWRRRLTTTHPSHQLINYNSFLIVASNMGDRGQRLSLAALM